MNSDISDMEICRVRDEKFSSGHELENYPISFQCHNSNHYHHEKREKSRENAAEWIKTRKKTQKVMMKTEFCWVLLKEEGKCSKRLMPCLGR
jgi:hypothetical protein